MKTLILIFLSLLLISSTSFGQNCKKLRNGNFTISGSNGGTTIIERRGNTQIEQMKPSGTKVVFDVEWVDDCTYKLKLRKVLYNPKNFDYPEGLIITTKIVEVKRDRYLVETTNNQNDQVQKAELLRKK